MSVKLRQRRKGGWEIDVRVVSPDGTRHARTRKRSPLASRSDAQRWAEGLERVMFQRLMDPAQHTRRKEARHTSIRATFMDGHARANRQKPSGIAAKEMILRVHLVPAWATSGWTRSRARRAAAQRNWMRNRPRRSQHPGRVSVLLKKALSGRSSSACRAR